MTLSRTFKKFTVIALAVVTSSMTFLSAPAHSAGLEVDFSAVTLPSGASITLDRATFEYGGTLLYISIKSPGAPANSVLKLKNIKASGLPEGVVSGVNSLHYFDLATESPNFNFLLTNTDLTQTNIKVSISGEGTYEKSSDLAYPKSYASTISNLDTLGIEVTEGYNTYSSDAKYGFYISVKTKPGVAPFSIVINKSELSGKSLSPVSLNYSGRVFEVSSTPVEIFLGDSSTDPTINMTEVAVSTAFRKYLPSTIRQEVKVPKNLEIVRLTEISYSADQKISYVGVVVKNTSKKTLNVDARTLIISSESLGSSRKIGAIDPQSSLATIEPTTGDSEENYYQFSFAIPSNIQENLKLVVSGTLAFATPSLINTSKILAPKGFAIQSSNFNNFSYDSKKKETQIWVRITKAGDPKAALKISGASIASGKVSQSLTYIPYYFDKEKNLSSYLFNLGSIAGDVRVGKKISLAANLTTVKQTSLTHTATLDPAITDIYFEPYSVYSPEFWSYDKKSNTTSIIADFQRYGLKESRNIYLCSLTIVADGKAVAAPSAPIVVRPYTYSDYEGYTIAKLSGDFRAGGHSVNISGRYSATGC